MPSLKDIRKRITSVKSTQQITRAMKMVSASKLRRAQERIQSFTAYADKMHEVVSGLADQIGPDSHPLLRAPETESKVLVIAVSSDRGLCGAFNTNVFKRAYALVNEKQEAGAEVDVMTVGRKVNDLLKRRKVNIVEHHTGIFDRLAFGTVAAIADKCIEQFLNEEYDGIYVVYNHFVSAITQKMRAESLLPLSAGDEQEAMKGDGEASIDYIYEPGKAEILDKVLPQSVRLHLYRGILDSIASEHGARMSAMDAATNNAKKALGRLTLAYNRARQAAITKELMEIVSGAEALK
jgi:F-type H+-transporting ATPase subunit gamma